MQDYLTAFLQLVLNSVLQKNTLPRSPTTYNVAIANKRHLQNHQLLMILLKSASSEAANGKCVSALRFPARPQGGSGSYLALISDLAIQLLGLISLGALSGGSNQNSLAEGSR